MQMERILICCDYFSLHRRLCLLLRCSIGIVLQSMIIDLFSCTGSCYHFLMKMQYKSSFDALQ